LPIDRIKSTVLDLHRQSAIAKSAVGNRQSPVMEIVDCGLPVEDFVVVGCRLSLPGCRLRLPTVD
jgi:hypothetical protein